MLRTNGRKAKTKEVFPFMLSSVEAFPRFFREN